MREELNIVTKEGEIQGKTSMTVVAAKSVEKGIIIQEEIRGVRDKVEEEKVIQEQIEEEIKQI
jgi:hypothetical protein